jgi:methylated-DNA-protein-cysteine methyltransferase-like protein
MMPQQDESLFPRIYEVVRQVPRGQVASYGRIAEIVGAGCDARMVGYAMHAIPEGSDVPWQRIVNREGKISIPGQGGEIQRLRLEAEGITFDARGRIDMKRFGWEGPDPKWAAEQGYHVKPRPEEPPEPTQPSLF